MNRPANDQTVEEEIQALLGNTKTRGPFTFTNDSRNIIKDDFVKDITPHHISPERYNVIPPPIPEVPRQSTTPTVDKMLDRFYSIQQETAKLCLQRAEELEAEAHDLRMRAAILDHQSVQIPEDYRIAVVNEREAALKVQRTMFVNPTEGS